MFPDVVEEDKFALEQQQRMFKYPDDGSSLAASALFHKSTTYQPLTIIFHVRIMVRGC